MTFNIVDIDGATAGEGDSSPPRAVAVGGTDSKFFSPLMCAPFNHDLIASPRTAIISFDAAGTQDFDTSQWISTVVGSATAVQSTTLGGVTLGTGVTSNSGITIQGVRIARMLSCCPLVFNSYLQVPDGASLPTNNNRSWGFRFLGQSGYHWKIASSGGAAATFNIVSMANNVETLVPVGSWNGASFTLDNNWHHYEIIASDNSAYFYIDKQLVHTLTSNTVLLTSGLDMNGHFVCQNNSGRTTDTTLKFRSFGISRIGVDAGQDRFFKYINSAATYVIKRGAGTLERVIINTVGSAGSTLAVYDHVSAISTSQIASINAVALVQGFEYGINLSRGLTVVATGFTTGNATVVYR